MKAQDFQKARWALGLSAKQLAAILNVDERTVRRWEQATGTASRRDPSPTAVRVVEWMLDGYTPPEWPETLRAGAVGVARARAGAHAQAERAHAPAAQVAALGVGFAL